MKKIKVTNSVRPPEIKKSNGNNGNGNGSSHVHAGIKSGNKKGFKMNMDNADHSDSEFVKF